MNSAKCDDHDYINFMIAAQRAFSCTEAARCQPTEDKAASHEVLLVYVDVIQYRGDDMVEKQVDEGVQ